MLWEKHLTLIGQVREHFQQVLDPLPADAERAALIARLDGTQIPEAFYLVHALHRSLAVPGDVCELGVAGGATSALIAHELLTTDRQLWLFDSFEGLSAPTAEDELIDDVNDLGSMDAYQGVFAYPETAVRSRVAEVGFPEQRTRVVPGFVEQSLGEGRDLPEQVCFAYVDMDLDQPIQVALDFLHDRMPQGAQIMVDDHGFFSAGAQKAVDAFVEQHAGAWVLELPEVMPVPFCILSRSQ